MSQTGPRVRLAGGPSPSEGVIEVFHHGKWGTICELNGEHSYADLVCKQLGFPQALNVAISDPKNHKQTGPIMLSNVMCSEMEKYLSECTHNGWFVHDCDHSTDVSVTCDRGKFDINCFGF